MAKNDQILQQRIEEETAKVKVDSYQKVASLGGWAGGGRTLWAISTIGAVAGAMIGLIAPFFPLIVGVSSLSIALGALPASLAIFTAVGMTTGFGGGLVLGRISGSAAAVAEENERRMKEWTVKQILHKNPNAEIVGDAPKAPAPKKSFGQRVKDNYHTYFNPRVGAVMTGIGIVGGLIMAAAFVYTGGAISVASAALSTLTGVAGIAGNTAAVTAYSAGVMGTFGALWFFNFPKITSEVTEFFGKLLDGSLLGRKWEPIPEKSQQPEKSPAPDYVVEESLAATKSFSDGKKRYSLAAIIHGREENVSPHDVTMTR